MENKKNRQCWGKHKFHKYECFVIKKTLYLLSLCLGSHIIMIRLFAFQILSVCIWFGQKQIRCGNPSSKVWMHWRHVTGIHYTVSSIANHWKYHLNKSKIHSLHSCFSGTPNISNVTFFMVGVSQNEEHFFILNSQVTSYLSVTCYWILKKIVGVSLTSISSTLQHNGGPQI